MAGYERAGGYQALRKALQTPPAQIQQWVTACNLGGRGGAGYPGGQEVERHCHGGQGPASQVSGGQCRRDGARHVQRPAPDGRGPQSRRRKRDRQRVRHRSGRGVSLSPVGLQVVGAAAGESPPPGLRPRVSGQEHSRLPLQSGDVSAHQRRPLYVRRERWVFSMRWRAAARSRDRSRPMRPRWGSGASPPSSTTSKPWPTSPISSPTARTSSIASAAPGRAARSSTA